MEHNNPTKNWSDQDKCKAFDRITDCYFQRNFGTMSKSDFEVLMFDILFQNLGSSPNTDYQLANILGITESRIRTLKVKRELKYPTENYDQYWKKQFLKDFEYVTYDDKSALAKVPVTDPNVRRELESYIDEQHYILESHLNSKLLQMRADQMISLALNISDEIGETDNVQFKLIEKLRSSKASDYIESEDILKRLKKEGVHALKDLSLNIVKKSLPEIATLLLSGDYSLGVVTNLLCKIIDSN